VNTRINIDTTALLIDVLEFTAMEELGDQCKVVFSGFLRGIREEIGVGGEREAGAHPHNLPSYAGRGFLKHHCTTSLA
jgi:hypothetical protein